MIKKNSKKKATKIEKLKFYFFIIIFKVTLDYIFHFIIEHEVDRILILSRVYRRDGFSFDFEPLKYLLGWIIYLLVVIFSKKKIIKDTNKAHELMILGLIMVSLAPSLTLFGLSNLSYNFIFLQIIFWFLLLGYTYLFCIKFRLSRIKYFQKLNNNWFYLIVSLYIIGSVIFIKKYSGFRINLQLGIDEVYSARLMMRQMGIPTFVNYFRNNAMYVIVPLTSVIFFKKNKKILFIFTLLLQLFLFSVDMQKTAFFLFVVSILGSRYLKKNSILRVPSVLTVLNIVSIFIYHLSGNLFLIENIAKRLYFLPSIISNCYYLYFSKNSFVVPFSSLFIKLGIISNYSYSKLQLPFAIGERYFGSHDISANTGLVGAAYSYSIIGILVIPLIYAILFKWLNKVTEKLHISWYISFLIIQIYVIINANIFSVITVYGYILGIFVLYLMNKNSKNFLNK